MGTMKGGFWPTPLIGEKEGCRTLIANTCSATYGVEGISLRVDGSGHKTRRLKEKKRKKKSFHVCGGEDLTINQEVWLTGGLSLKENKQNLGKR